MAIHVKPSVFGIVYLLPTASTHIFIQKIYINISLSLTVEGGGTLSLEQPANAHDRHQLFDINMIFWNKKWDFFLSVENCFLPKMASEKDWVVEWPGCTYKLSNLKIWKIGLVLPS